MLRSFACSLLQSGWNSSSLSSISNEPWLRYPLRDMVILPPVLVDSQWDHMVFKWNSTSWQEKHQRCCWKPGEILAVGEIADHWSKFEMSMIFQKLLTGWLVAPFIFFHWRVRQDPIEKQKKAVALYTVRESVSDDKPPSFSTPKRRERLQPRRPMCHKSQCERRHNWGEINDQRSSTDCFRCPSWLIDHIKLRNEPKIDGHRRW